MSPEMQSVLSLSDLYRPCEASVSPAIDIGAAAIEEAVIRFELMDRARAQKYILGFSRNAGTVYPQADARTIIPCAHSMAWMFFFDDAYDEDRDFATDDLNLGRFMDEHLEILKTGQLPAKTMPLMHYTLELRKSLLKEARGEHVWLSRFCQSIEDSMTGARSSVRWWVSGENPTIETYLPVRDHSSAVYPSIDLIEIASKIHITDAVFRDPVVRRLRHLCVRTVALTNDLFSYEAEVLKFGHPSNLIAVLMAQHKAPTVKEATNLAVRLVNSYVHEMEKLLQSESTLIHSHDGLSEYVNGMFAWISGHIAWSMSSPRYRSPTSPFPELRDHVDIPAAR